MFIQHYRGSSRNSAFHLQHQVKFVAMHIDSKANLVPFTLLLQSVSAISSHAILSETVKAFQAGTRENSFRRRNHPVCLHRGNLAYMIPDVEWWNANAVGWTGSVPQEDRPAHGLFEQVMHRTHLLSARRTLTKHRRAVFEQIFVDGFTNFLSW